MFTLDSSQPKSAQVAASKTENMPAKTANFMTSD